MARITVEDCLDHVANRFSLVLVAAERAKQLIKGDEPQLDEDFDNKEVVTALREIAAGRIQVNDDALLAEESWTSKPLSVTDFDDELPPEA